MPVEDLMRMDSILETSPVVIASREGPGAMRTGEPLHRHLMGRAFNLLTRAMALPHVRDTQCGLKGFSAIGARDIFSRQSIDGFGFDVELLLIASRLGYAVQEMPIRWSHRPSSRVDPVRDTLRMVVDLLRIKWKDCLGVYTSTPFELAHPAAGQASTASPATEP
jgi:dolichyl-phosphate beta-glucosyltransferase